MAVQSSEAESKPLVSKAAGDSEAAAAAGESAAESDEITYNVTVFHLSFASVRPCSCFVRSLPRERARERERGAFAALTRCKSRGGGCAAGCDVRWHAADFVAGDHRRFKACRSSLFLLRVDGAAAL
jgi:hypothetical protein